MSLESYIEQFDRLRVNRRGDHVSPHKPCMLLAVIGLAEAGLLRENKLTFQPPLLDRYLEIFSIVAGDSDHANPYFPFFHLRSERFWHLVAVPGREAVVEAMSTARSYGDIENNISYVRLDDGLHELLQAPAARSELRANLITRWFGEFAAKLTRARQADEYELQLRNVAEHGIEEVAVETYEHAVRSTAFRRVVTDMYDYRCAASGLRIVLPGELVLVEAAHLIPHSETHDDDPRNGMALTPNFHWALDRNIIAPGPDYKWHVSKIVDDRVPDNQVFCSLQGKEIVCPKDKNYWPRQDALAACLARLKAAELVYAATGKVVD